MTALPTKLESVMAKDNIELSAGAGSTLWKGLAGLGTVLTAVTIVAAFASGAVFRATALHSLHVGFLVALSFPLAALVFVMILHQTAAGWSATIRRQFENMMSLVWIAVPMFFGILALQWLFNIGIPKTEGSPYLWQWMNTAHTEGDALYANKAAFLNVWFFLVRAIVYFIAWIGLSMALWSLSTRQDSDGNKWHTVTARKISAVGLPIFAITTAFAGFDWIMSIDYHWFSTMLGVHFFARCMVSMLSLGILTFIVLRSTGRLHVAFTDEHLHDLSKLLFAFIVFWAYISFSQYFLIWYANIPEETTFFQIRKTGDWRIVSWILPIVHFIIPFLVLLPRPARRSRAVMAVMCVYMIAAQMLDGYWYIRPMVDGVGPWQWVDLAGILGPVLIFLGLYVRKVASGPLIPLKDPRLPEGLHHKNYV